MKGVPVDRALDYVAGYAPANDVGLHDFRHADRGSMLRVKGQDGFLPIGPEVVPAAEFDPTDFTLRTYVNGEVVQEATADDLLFGVAYQLADLSRLITLEPGDVLLTGTPGELAADGAGRRGRGRDRRPRSADEHGGRLGRRPDGGRRAAATSANTLHVALAIPEDEAERMVERRESMKVHVDMNLCQSHGECAFVAPEVFELGDDDVLVWKEEVGEELRAKVEEAVDVCPMMAIRIED